MARTEQTARGANGRNGVVDNPDLDDEQLEQLKKLEEEPMKAELKHIDRKYTEQGQQYYAETTEEEIPEQTDWWTQFALCLVRYMDGSNRYVQKTAVQINSQHIKDILKDLIGSFPGISFATKDITVDAPYRVLYHYRTELQDAAKDFEDGSEASEHVKVLLDFIDEKFEDTISESANLQEQGLMSYQHLWTIFKPGMTIYAPVFGQPRAFTLNSYQYVCGQNPGLQLQVSYVDFDGEDFGTTDTSKFISAFSGAEKINELEAFPLSWHESPGKVTEELITRGKRFEQYAGMHFCCYQGVAFERTGCGISRYNIDGRVVVDVKTYHRLNANHAFGISPFKRDDGKGPKAKRSFETDEDLYDDDDYEEAAEETAELVPDIKLDLQPLTDKQRMLANAMVRGFSFSEKKWCDFFLDKLTPVDWNDKCFDQLVLPNAQKELVQALVATHTQQKLGFDDIVKGKGKGLILVLHGPPGVGKTLTAETVAEFSHRPLYIVSSGDLGTDSSTLDQRLSRILDMASTWKAVLLIDEADVFLERRALHDMERNALVSIFLRVLEYYEGILFLTSNRVNTFDDAFKSRIHVPLKYGELPVESRNKIWRNFLSKIEGGVDMNDAGYGSLSQADLNGRQIKNVIRTAKSLAQFHKQRLDRKKLEQVISIQQDFERELDLADGGATNGVNGINGTL